MNDSSPVTFHREDRAAFVTLNRPPLNILDFAVLEALDKALAEAASEDSKGRCAGVVVLRSEGAKCFCAGVDVGIHTPDKVPAMLERFHGALRRLHRMEALTLCVLQGPALGGGAELALVCDMLLAAEGAVLGFPEIKLGCFPPVAMALLGQHIGHHRAVAMIATGESIGATQAMNWGLVHRTAPAGDLESLVRQTLAGLLEKSPAVLGLAARGTRAALDATMEDSLTRAEALYLERLTAMPDMAEGIRAFMEKRAPVWK